MVYSMILINLIVSIIAFICFVCAYGVSLNLTVEGWFVYIGLMSIFFICVQGVAHLLYLILELVRYWRKTRGR